MQISKFWLRTLGLVGILGGLSLFAGDMLFYYDSLSTNLKFNMANASDTRLTLSGITALVATWFYLLALVPVYYAFTPGTAFARNSITISFAGILVAYGIVHAAYVAIATTAKLGLQYHIDILEATKLAVDINQVLRLFVYPLFAFLSFMFIREVWKKRTLYPRWIILFFPLIPFLFKGILSTALSGRLSVIINGGFLNLILVVFFLASTIALWNTPKSNS